MLPVIFLTVVVDLIGFGLILPLLPFFAVHFGASPFTVALLAVAFSVAQFLAAPVMGSLSDRVGRRPVFLGCMLLSIIGYVCLAFADSLLAIFLARIVTGIGGSKIGVAQAIIADSTPPHQRARGMGLIGSAFGIGMILGPVIGGLLIGPDPLHPHYRLPIIAAAVTSSIALLFAVLKVRETHQPQPELQVRLWSNPFGTLPRLGRTVVVLILISFVINFVFSQIETLFPLFVAARLDWHAYEVGLAFTFIGSIVLTVQGILIGPLTRWFGEARLLTYGMLSLAAGCAMAHLVTDIPSIAISILLTASGLATVNPSLSSLVSRNTDPARQGAAMSSMQSLGALGRTLGPAWGGWLFDHAGINIPYWIGGAILLATLAFCWRVIHARLPAETQ
ncbi:MAG: MFS transporter [Ferrovibrio sp.]|uniref:MFS transporter n=1 Tax=Ferrovibrio sp. TaxID=1917215 RepID=UPI00391BF757